MKKSKQCRTIMCELRSKIYRCKQGVRRAALTTPLLGILTGTVNILIGSCGGIIAVETLKLRGIDQTKSHATAIAIILPLSMISAAGYLIKGQVRAGDSLVYLLPGLIGSAIGSLLLPKIPKNVLSKVFSIFIIYAGVRMLMK